jgi:hypothetical protein
MKNIFIKEFILFKNNKIILFIEVNLLEIISLKLFLNQKIC